MLMLKRNRFYFLRGQRKTGGFFMLWGCCCISIVVTLSANPITPSLRKWLPYLRTIGVMGVSVCTFVIPIGFEKDCKWKTYFCCENSYKCSSKRNATPFIMILDEFWVRSCKKKVFFTDSITVIRLNKCEAPRVTIQSISCLQILLEVDWCRKKLLFR